MEGRSQLLVRFKGGNHTFFDINGYDDYLGVKNQLVGWFKGWFNRWLFIGGKVLLKKSDVNGVFYCQDGYAKNIKVFEPSA